MEITYQELKEFGSVRQNEPLHKHTTFKIGGDARFFVSVVSVESCVSLLQLLDGRGVPFFILGGGSNMLASDTPYDGVVIHLAFQEIVRNGEFVHADAGCTTVSVARFSMAQSLTGFEWGVGVPGTIGGAVRGNAGAMGFEMRDTVHEVLVYRDGEMFTMTHDECAFGYRTSVFKVQGGVVLRVTLRLSPTTDKAMMKRAIEYLSYRNRTQPQGYASTGCIFKNININEDDVRDDTERELARHNKEILLAHFDPTDEKVQQFLRVGKISAGWLVEQVGLKGYQKGEALVSERHGNFIVNMGGASSTDVVELIEHIKDTVYTTYGLLLEEEIHRV